MPQPTVTAHPWLETFTFHVKDCPRVMASRLSKGNYSITPEYITIETRPRGVRLKIFGRTHDGQHRHRVFNIRGYEANESPPGWAVLLWRQARAER
jgi:hypothetical protein